MSRDKKAVQQQLLAGRDHVSHESYWVAYVQSGFQSSPLDDWDPILDGGVLLGTTSASYGSLVFTEAIDDRANREPAASAHCNKKVVAHEVGHQLGISGHDYLGIMQSGCSITQLFFDGRSLHFVRATVKP